MRERVVPGIRHFETINVDSLDSDLLKRNGVGTGHAGRDAAQVIARRDQDHSLRNLLTGGGRGNHSVASYRLA
ncbi:MAG: hypothetical protein NT151_04350 [Acidobacteria bacterium]|nr:hypothetical protein [Acidobacteriota bacterium]